MLDARQSHILSLLRRQGPLSRQQLHQAMKLRPNTVGQLVDGLIKAGLLCEGPPQPAGPGRPRVPLEIDPQRRQVVGLALQPGRVGLATFNLHGLRVGATRSSAAKPATIIDTAASLLRSVDLEPVVAIGVSSTGLVDERTHQLLVSSTTARVEPVSLQPLFDIANSCPLILENDLQALAVQWLLTHEAEANDDILLISIRDGAVGAAVLVDGRPIRGCVMGGNELGHTRLPVQTPMCYCGHTGCLERICSSDFLHMQHNGDSSITLAEAIERYRGDDGDLQQVIHLLGIGIGNAITLLRPRRVVLASEFNRCTAYTNALLQAIRGHMLSTLVERVRIDLWDRQSVEFADAAAWLALASIYNRLGADRV